MTSRAIPQTDWKTFFDSAGEALVGKRAEIEAASLDLGDQIVATRLPLLGVSYDAQDDLIDVSLSGLDHRIRHPRQIYVSEGAAGVETIAVESADGVTQILHLTEPLKLAGGPRRTR